jgi:hypothetical protein
MRTPRRKVLLSPAGGETGRILTLPPIKERRLKSTERGCGQAQPQTPTKSEKVFVFVAKEPRLSALGGAMQRSRRLLEVHYSCRRLAPAAAVFCLATGFRPQGLGPFPVWQHLLPHCSGRLAGRLIEQDGP